MTQPIPPARSRRRYRAMLGILLAIQTPILADEPRSAGRKEVLKKVLSDFKGSAELRSFSHQNVWPVESRIRGEGILNLEWNRRLADRLKVRLEGQVRSQGHGFTEGVRFRAPDREQRRSQLEFKESAVTFEGGPAEISLGRQVFSWGEGTLFNPTDNLNPHDLMDIVDREKMGVYSAAGNLRLENIQTTFVFVPWFTPSRDPLPHGRWVPRSLAAIGGTIKPRQDVPITGENAQYALRVKSWFQGWEGSASCYRGREHTPSLVEAVENDPVLGPVTRRTPIFPVMESFGWDVSTTYRRFVLHAEWAIKYYRDRELDNRLQWLMGFDYSWEDFGRIPIENITLEAEYLRENELTSRDRGEILGAGGYFGSAFRNSAGVGVSVKKDHKTSLKTGVLVNFESSFNYLAQISLTHKVTESIRVKGGADVLTGRADSFWGQWRDNDRIFFSLKFFF